MQLHGHDGVETQRDHSLDIGHESGHALPRQAPDQVAVDAGEAGAAALGDGGFGLRDRMAPVGQRQQFIVERLDAERQCRKPQSP